MPPKFFITHSWKDIDFSRQLCNDLRAHGLEGFFDERSLKPSESVPSSIARGLEECDVYIPVLSPAALQSQWCDWEMDIAITLNRDATRGGRPRIMPVIAEKCVVPTRLRHLLYVDFTNDYAHALNDLLTKGFETTPQFAPPPRTTETRRAPSPTAPPAEMPPPKRRSDKDAERYYLEHLIEEHKYFTILGRAKPLDLEKIYIALKVGEYVPRQYKPDEVAQAEDEERPKFKAGTVQVPEALLLHRRLAVLGEPGSGKTTLLKYLALRIAKRDRALGEFARERMPRPITTWAMNMHQRLESVNSQVIGFLLGLVACGFWIWGLFNASNVGLAIVSGIVLLVALGLIFARLSKRAILICTLLTVGIMVYSALTGLVPLLAIGVMGLALVVLLYPYWIQPLLVMLNGLRERTTRFPLPVYLTLNDLAKSDVALQAYLAQELHHAGFANPQQFLQQKLERGECLILLDALDEVVDEAVYRRVADEINRLALAFHRNQIIVTCRIAGYRDVLNGFQQLEVQEFDDQQVKLFTQNWFAARPKAEQAARVDGLMRCLERSVRMRLLAANPLLLSIIALLYERDFNLPERRVELYEECAQVLLARREREKGLEATARFPVEKKARALESLAGHFHQARTRVFTQDALATQLASILPELGYPAADHAEFLGEIIERSGLVRKKSRTTLDFTHLTFQEYFAARAFFKRNAGEWLFTHLDDPWWREVILLFVGLQDDATVFLGRLKKHDVLLAAFALADVRPVKTPAFEQVAGEIIAELKQVMENEPARRQDAADALAEIARWGASEYLVTRARDEQAKTIALSAILALAKAADRQVWAGLCEPLGPILRLLNGSLGRVNADADTRILAVLEMLGFPMVFVPAGEFVMGSDTNVGDEKPQHKVHLDDYWIAKYPVTNAQFRCFADETQHQATNWRSEFTSGKENHPVVNVNWEEANAFCKWAGTRLPTEAQWEKSARGTDGRVYPWGNQWDASRCNVSGTGTTPVDRYPDGISPYGCYDMAGNVRNWCADWYAADYYKNSPMRNPEGPSSGTDRVTRGGSWGNFQGDARCAVRGGDNPGNRDDNIGFRVAESFPT